MKALIQILLLLVLAFNARAQFDERDFPEDRIIMSGSGAVKIPTGVTGQRPSGGNLQEGMMRLNTDTIKVEVYKGGTWVNVSGATQFSDDEFEVFNLADPTKIAKIDSSLILPGNTRTYSLPDSSGIFSLLEIDQTFSGVNTFSDDLLMIGTGQIQIPSGTTAQRSSSPIEGMLRYNTDLSEPEIYSAGTWKTIGDINTVLGPISSTDNAIVRWDTTTGLLIQDSAVTVDDQGRIAQTALTSSVVIGIDSALNDDNTNRLTAVGVEAAKENVIGDDVTAIGYQAAKGNTANYNTAVGSQALETSSNASAIGNTAVGDSALQNSDGSEVTNNTAIGHYAQRSAVSGSSNTSVGSESLENNSTGDRNTTIGFQAGTGIISSDNVAIGNLAAGNASGGTMARNVMIGSLTGDEALNATDNILIGYDVDLDGPDDTDKLNIGNFLYGDMDAVRLGVGVPNPTAGLDVAGSGNFTGGVDAGAHSNIYTLDTTGNINVGGTGHLKVPSGNTAQRTSIPEDGMIRYNYELLQYEAVVGGAWLPLGGGGGGGGDVYGPPSSTDNAIATFDGITGKVIQESLAIVSDAGDINTPGNITIGEGSSLEFDISDTLYKASSTGMSEPTTLAANGGDNTKFDIGPVYGQIVDSVGGNYVAISYAGATAVTPSNTSGANYLLINDLGVLVQQASPPTPQERRQNIFVGRVVTNATVVAATVVEPVVTENMANSVWDLMLSLGRFNDNGNRITSSGANLSIDKTVGAIFSAGANYDSDREDPNRVTSASCIACTFFPILRTGVGLATRTTLDVGNYDVGGVVTAISGGGNTSTNQRVYLFPSGNLVIAYGQNIYSNPTNARAAIATESFIKNPLLDGGVLIAIISVKKSATDLTNPLDVFFSYPSKFGETASGAGSTGATTLQAAYEASTQPQMIVTSAKGAVQVADASTPIAAPLFEVVSNDTLIKYFSVEDDTTTITGKVSQLGLGGSTLFGEDAGLNDDLSSNELAAFGAHALESTTTGIKNTAIGNYALQLNTTANYNTAVGYEALNSNTSGSNNTGIGYRSLSRTTTLAMSNTGVGYNSGLRVEQGDHNTLIGAGAGEYIANGVGNTMVGSGTGLSNVTGTNNTFIGYRAGAGSSSNSNNLFVGYDMARNVTTGSDNIMLGYDMDLPTPTTSNYLSIGGIITGDTSASTVNINGYFGVTSADKGSVPAPKMTEAERDALVSPVTGDQIYNTTANQYNYYNGTIWDVFGGAAVTVDLQTAYDNSTQAQTVLTDALGSFQIADNSTPITGPLFEVTDNGDTESFLSVDTGGVDVSGALTVSSTTEASTPCPVMTEVQRNALTPSAGECIYSTDTNSQEIYDGTNWILVKPAGIPTMAKGSLFASNGVANGEFAACADGEILEWDAAETAGFKCVAPLVLAKGELRSNNGSIDVAVPACADGESLEYDSAEADGTKCVSTPAVNYAISSSSGNYSTTSTSFTDITNQSITITTGGGPVEISAFPDGSSNFSLVNSAVESEFRILRGGTVVGYFFNAAGNDSPVSMLTAIDIPAAGTYTYKIQAKANTSGSVVAKYMKTFAREIK